LQQILRWNQDVITTVKHQEAPIYMILSRDRWIEYDDGVPDMDILDIVSRQYLTNYDEYMPCTSQKDVSGVECTFW